jgi:hypothetical protein
MSYSKEYHSICEQIKQLEKRKTELRAILLGVVGDSPAILLDGVMITQDQRERTTLDREALTQALGVEGLKPYLKVTSYIELRTKILG